MRRYRLYLSGLVSLVAIVSFASGWLLSNGNENRPTADEADAPAHQSAGTSVAAPSSDTGAPTPDLGPPTPGPGTMPAAPAPAATTEPPADTAAEPTSPTADPQPTSTPIPAQQPAPAATPALDQTQLPYEQALAVAGRLAPMVFVPSDCGIPMDHPISLPNSPREYRAGTHQGIDFICAQTGRSAHAALDGRVVVAVGDYAPPSPQDRDALLGTAKQIGETPPWTLAMLYGNYVVIDHGYIDDVGHTATLYAHLSAIDPDIRIGQFISAGTRLGEIGNLGTSSSSTGIVNYNSLHLHWEIYVDNVFLAAGLSPNETRDVYARLFSVGP